MVRAKVRKDNAVNWSRFLTIVGIISFLAIFSNSAFSLNLDALADGLLFMILGVALLVTGGVHLLVEYFKDGLDPDEISKIISILIGVAAITAGITVILGLKNSFLLSIRAIVSLLAIIIMASGEFSRGKKK